MYVRFLRVCRSTWGWISQSNQIYNSFQPITQILWYTVAGCLEFHYIPGIGDVCERRRKLIQLSQFILYKKHNVFQ